MKEIGRVISRDWREEGGGSGVVKMGKCIGALGANFQNHSVEQHEL